MHGNSNIKLWYDSLFGQRRTAHCAKPDCNSCDSVGIDKETTRAWLWTVYGQLLLLPRLIRWLDHETNLLLWYCLTLQEGHATGLWPHGGDLQVWTRGDLTEILWRDKCDVCILTNIHDPPAEGNFRNSNGKAIKPQIVADYNCHMGFVDKGDRMANSYSINRRTWKWTKKLFFHLFDLAILNSYILFSSMGGKKISHSNFQDILLGNLLAQAGHELNVQRPIGRPPAATTQVIRFEEHGRKYWPISSAMRRWCLMCAGKGVTRNVLVICKRCDVALCCDRSCFKDYHNKADPWNISACSTGSPYEKLRPQLEMWGGREKEKEIERKKRKKVKI